MIHRRAAGFTLLEALVTLVIVSLLVSVLMQALAHSLDLRSRLLRIQQEARTGLLQEAWFREVVGAAQADLDDALGGMEGEPDALSFASAMPLAANGMSRVHWRLHDGPDGEALYYSDAAVDDVVVVRGPFESASFAYRDRGGTWHREWKPAPDAEDRLPRLVRFEARTAGATLYWLVPLLADPMPREIMRPDELSNAF